MGQIKVPLMALYRFDNRLFDDLALPVIDGKPFAEPGLVRTNILLECGELGVFYTNPDFMRVAIKAWSNKMLPVWQKLANSEHFVYNPVENYDRHEEWTDDSTGASTTEDTGHTDNTGSGWAFDSDAWQNQNKDVGDVSSSGSANTTSNSKHVGYTHGNIGIRSAQELIEQERKLDLFNTIDKIIDDFKHQFCVVIY